MGVSFGELKIGDVAKGYLQQVIDTSWASEGPLVAQFESEWKNLFGYSHSVAMSSGTDACINACLALYDVGAKRGDEIICPALTFVATVNAILAAGFTPNFVDISRDTLNIDADQIEQAITSSTKAIMVTHTMGKPCEMDKIIEIASNHNLYVLEDSCEAHGAKFRGNYVGKIGHIAMFSFYAAHIVVAGEGGMCSTDHDDLAESLKSTKTHGRKPGSDYFDFIRLGLNSKMNEFTAAVGLEGLSQYHETVRRRNENKQVLFDSLADLKGQIRYWEAESFEEICPHAFPILLTSNDSTKRNDLYRFLESRSIQCKTLFGCIPTQHRAFEFLGHILGAFPEAEYVGNNGLHFGIHQYLTGYDMAHVSEALHDFFA